MSEDSELSSIDQLREAVESLVDEGGTLLCAESDVLETIGWIGALTHSNELVPGDVREWAKANGHHVNERGRIPTKVRIAYRLANEK